MARFLGGRDTTIHVLLFSSACNLDFMASRHLGSLTASAKEAGLTPAVIAARKAQCRAEKLL